MGEASGMVPQLLRGIRIADFTIHAAGPYATLLLGELGAEVIRIESGVRLDITRRPHPVYGRLDVPTFDQVNANKRSVALNLKTPRGAGLAKAIVARCDVAVENFRPGVLARLGLDYEALRAVRPDLVMASISTSGQEGPERGIAGYAPMFSALGGLGYLTGYPDGPPVELRHAMDHTNGLMGAFAVLAALYHRRLTGEGQYVDLSMREVAASFIGDALLACAATGEVPGRLGNADPVMAPHNCYRCRGEDAWISIAVGSDAEWAALRRAMGDPAWAAEARLADGYGRWMHAAELDKRIEEWTAQHSPAELFRRLQEAGVASMPSCSARDLLADPHLAAREAFPELADERYGRRRVVSPPWKFSRTPAAVWRWTPALGEDNAYVFCELLGLSADEVRELQDSQVIA